MSQSRIKEQQLQVSASIGIIFLPSGESGINSAKIILAEADNAMYQAKRAGKNTIFVHELAS
ncbi:diguanylate cyclase [Pseudidiomarina sp. PP-1MA]|uniref:Diguanylate cyclase n=1 Tax=Pseudidiomarina sp. PP-1MA TaxID=3237706 RepID=A0AB39XAD5_9GAMM